ncbi:hypothetical protein FYJ85_11140 [Victivallaceae bacterium BBE-744-WT-12]|uniref:Phosphoadenosine phosphosulfate reductase family protein n=1 Tax=Victivallis lenta TaxID=2606640 RepID=A0A844G360_9BACT|nr:hypothetical protein [Victivallis lenta]MST97593.1 hypothetical protein [Victivallis lenta]
MKHIVCYSGGIESALAAIEVVRKYGRKNVILVNHNICTEAEDPDIKDYKYNIADYLGLNIEFVTAQETFPHLDPIKTCIEIRAFKVGKGRELCTAKLKTEPFMRWLSTHYRPDECVIYYGFTSFENNRCARRIEAMCKAGWRLDFPLLWWDRTIYDTAEIGIPRPEHYQIWQHGNCIGCLKAGWLHWYCVYVHRRDRWELAKKAEKEIGYTINRRNNLPCLLIEREEEFEVLRRAGLPATEWIPSGKFWSMARNLLKNNQPEFNFKEDLR